MNVNVVQNVEVIVEAGVVVEVSVDHQLEGETVDRPDLAEDQEVDQDHSR